MKKILVSIGHEGNAVQLSPAVDGAPARTFAATGYTGGAWLDHAELGKLVIALPALALPRVQREAETGALLAVVPLFGIGAGAPPIGTARVRIEGETLSVAGVLDLRRPEARALAVDADAGLPLDLLLEVEPERIGPDSIERNGEAARIIGQSVLHAVHLAPLGAHIDSPAVAKVHGRTPSALEVAAARGILQGTPVREAAAAIAKHTPEALRTAKGRTKAK